MTFGILKNEKEIVELKAGEILFNEGDPGDVMFAVLEGEIEIFLHGQSWEVVKAGNILGEMALIDAKPRSAQAVAKTDARVAPINKHRFTLLVQQTPFFALQVMEVMATRLRRF